MRSRQYERRSSARSTVISGGSSVMAGTLVDRPQVGSPVPSPPVPELAFVMSPNQNWFFREFVETLRHELAEQGVPSSVHTDGFPEPTPERVYALVPPHEFVALEGEDALPDESILRRTIFICAEQPGTVHLDQDVELSRR